jgi:excinuclease UvrABC ATPase subunit
MLGSASGKEDGRILAESTPPKVAKVKKSFTSKFLKLELGGKV